MTLKELYEKCKDAEDYKIIIHGNNSEGWYEVCDEISIDDEEKEITLYMGWSV